MNIKQLKTFQIKGISILEKKPKYLGNESLLDEISKIVKYKKYSFDIIAGRMKLNKNPVTFSTQTLYNYYHKGLLKISNFHLPNFGYIKHSKRTRRSNLSHKSIDLRPLEINERKEPMHWEMDCIVSSKNQGSALLVLSERLTRFELIFKISEKNTANVVATLDNLQKKLKDNYHNYFRSITTDNGSEFQDYINIEKNQRTIQYFAHPFTSCERGANENLNREIRKFFPKRTRFNSIEELQIFRVQNWMNNKPRKVLGYLSSIEAMKNIYPEFVKKINA